jgi:hypothetical protein
MAKKKDILGDVDKRLFMNELQTDIFELVRVASYALDSWSIRMSIEVASGITEERLEQLGARIELAAEKARRV